MQDLVVLAVHLKVVVPAERQVVALDQVDVGHFEIGLGVV